MPRTSGRRPVPDDDIATAGAALAAATGSGSGVTVQPSSAKTAALPNTMDAAQAPRRLAAAPRR